MSFSCLDNETYIPDPSAGDTFVLFRNLQHQFKKMANYASD